MPTVLIVEDDDDFRTLVKMLLELEGYAVHAARHGLDGLEQLRHSQPCAILLDLMMPVMDGFEFRRRQLALPEPLRSIPVICVTAIAADAKVLGVPCLRKPVNPDELLTIVREICPG
jgi:CheY-like chemotaxis protein